MSEKKFIKVGYEFINLDFIVRVTNKRRTTSDEWAATIHTVDGESFEAQGNEAENILVFVDKNKLSDPSKLK
jgi:hypothetical protein